MRRCGAPRIFTKLLRCLSPQGERRLGVRPSSIRRGDATMGERGRDTARGARGGNVPGGDACAPPIKVAHKGLPLHCMLRQRGGGGGRG